MKKNILKYYMAAFYLCSTFVMLAQTDPGTGGVDNGDGSGDTTPAAPIDDYVWVLAVVGLLIVFMKFRAMNKKINS